MARILAVGNTTLDIINVVERYPGEDQELRALAQHIVRGGNATNTLVVLSQLGHGCAWAGTLADEPDAEPVLADLERYAIDTSAVHIAPEGKVPTSYVTLSRDSGSRTIVHYRDLDEYSHRDFAQIDLNGIDWLHFEGRNIDELRKMLELTRNVRPELPISLEVEKPREGIESLFCNTDLLLFSKDYARQQGFHNAEALLHKLREMKLGALMTCSWGEAGAYALNRQGELIHSPAFPPPMTVDTLGAGDVFNAGMIDGLLGGKPLEAALIDASRLAGRKCGLYGLHGLVE